MVTIVAEVEIDGRTGKVWARKFTVVRKLRLANRKPQTHSIPMKIDLPPETQASLAARAAAEGMSLLEYVARRLREEVTQDIANTLSPAERAAAWRGG